MFNRVTLQAAFDLLEHLQGQGFTAAIAGGCPRDLFFGVRPKDADIIVTGSNMLDVGAAMFRTNMDFKTFYRYEEATCDRMEGCFKLEGCDIDVVVYRADDIAEAVQHFDFNINQFVISGAHDGLKEATIRFLGKDHWMHLKPAREDFTPERHLKMIAKHGDLMTTYGCGSVFTSEVGLKDRLYVL